MITILYEDVNIVFCIKPAGVTSEEQMTLMLEKQLNSEIYALHRLDKPVSGVMVYARSSKSAAALSTAIQNGEMVKEYLALVHGTPDDSGIMEDLLFKDSSKNKVYVVKRERKGVKKAKLQYDVVRAGDTSLVHIRLYTGRSHQIRVQFASRGFPLVGDRKYGAKDDVAVPMLFSSRITFPHKGENLVFEAKPEWA